MGVVFMTASKPMKILYAVRFRKKRNPLHHSALDYKLDSQITGLVNSGCDVILSETGLSKSFLIDRIKSLVNEKKYISNSTENDVFYIRGPFDYFVDIFLLSPKKCKYVYEAQDIEEYVHRRSLMSTKGIRRLFSVYMCISIRLFDTILKKRMSGIVSVTGGISNYNQEKIGGGCKYITIGNGISCNNFSIRKIPLLKDRYNILCVANVRPWHGIDRFIRGISEYKSSSNAVQIVLHVVGDGPELATLKELTSELNLQDNVIFYGYKSGKELDEMFDMCHIALGSLGGFRINMHEMSSLKSGEYCARGMPFVIAAKAIDFPDDWPYILHVPETEESINMDDVIMFADRVMADTNHPLIMREYAEQNLDWSIKMKKLKEFLESL